MNLKAIKDLYQDEPIGLECSIGGWIKSLRKAKSFAFVVLNDGSTQKDLQVIVDEHLSGYDELIKANTGSSVSFTVKIVESQGKQKFEAQAKEIEFCSVAADDYPLQKKGTSMEFLRDVSHLRSRTNTFGAVFRVRHALTMATHNFFNDRGFFNIHTPILTAMDAEGAGEMFRVSHFDPQNIPLTDKGEVDWSKDYFGKEAFLAVTGQLEGEAFACSMGKIYTFGPTFRSEKSYTARHLSEFWMIEPEVAFADLDDIADLGRDYIKYLIEYALNNCPDEMDFFNRFIDNKLFERLGQVMSKDFVRISYTQAVAILQESGKKFEFKVEWGADLQTEHEKFLTDEHFKGPVIVTDYPTEIKAFYMKRNEDGKTVRAMDILVPQVGEIIGGSQREDDYQALVGRMQDMKMDLDLYKWYLDLRRFGSVPHAGFGLGFERAVMYITGMKNIKDVIPFARSPKNLEF